MPYRTPSDLAHDARRLRLDTLVRLRWLAVAGQAAAVALVQFGFGFPLPFGLCFLVIALSAWVNLALRIRFPASHRLSDNAATLLLAFDILQLAALLYLTGGLQNPFAMLVLAPVLISATALTPERTLGLGLLAVGSATLLVLVHRQSAVVSRPEARPALRLRDRDLDGDPPRHGLHRHLCLAGGGGGAPARPGPRRDGARPRPGAAPDPARRPRGGGGARARHARLPPSPSSPRSSTTPCRRKARSPRISASCASRSSAAARS